jgi:uncharacterized membrane protein
MTEWETPVPAGEKGQGTVMLVYVLLLASVLVWPAGVVGVIIAYVYKEDAPLWLQSHYRLQIRTFWISILYILLGMLLLVAVVGYVILLFWLVWFLVRCIKGIRYLNRGQAYPNPEAWLF